MSVTPVPVVTGSPPRLDNLNISDWILSIDGASCLDDIMYPPPRRVPDDLVERSVRNNTFPKVPFFLKFPFPESSPNCRHRHTVTATPPLKHQIQRNKIMNDDVPRTDILDHIVYRAETGNLDSGIDRFRSLGFKLSNSIVNNCSVSPSLISFLLASPPIIWSDFF